MQSPTTTTAAVRVRVRVVQAPMRHGFSSDEARAVMEILRRPDGWGRHGVAFERVWRADVTDVVIYLRPPAYMDRVFGTAPRLRGLSVTDHGTRPTSVHIHAGNWASPPPGFGGSRRLYRAYLVQHEMGHCLGLGHVRPPPGASSRPCPVMYQQTRGTTGLCRPSAATPTKKTCAINLVG